MRGLSLTTAQIQISPQFLDDRGQRAGFVLLMAFLLSFLFIRTSTRLIRKQVRWWPGNVSTSGGLHVHHMVFGIVLLLLSGFLSFVIAPGSPRTELIAAAFGVGAGLTLDEFALWLHLEDVYWAEEGRASFRAVLIAAVLGALLLTGTAPFGDPNNGGSIATFAAILVIDVALAAVAIVKGKFLLGLIGIFVPIVSLVGAIRLASPNSIWAHRFYDPEGRKMARARERWGRVESRRLRLSDAIAGAPGISDRAKPDADRPAAAERVGDR